MPEDRKPSSLQLEKLINSVEGVISCKVVSNESGEIVEVHILAGDQRSPKQIVRDIETTSMVQLGLELDHKKISVAQVHNDMVIPGKRLLLRGISFALVENQVEVAVELAYGDRVEVGHASGRKTQSNQQRLLAQATLQAVTSFLGDQEVFVLEQVSVQPFAQQTAVLVAVALLSQEQEDMLLGAALVRGDQREAIVRATLDAVNRRSWQMMSV